MKLLFIVTSIVFVSCSTGIKEPTSAKNRTSLKTFKDPMNTAVFTTKFVILDKKDITLVRHDSDDGAWTFFSNDKYDNYNDVAKLIGLGQIIAIDSTVLEIADLPLGYYASRDSKKDDWKVEKLKEK